MIYGSYIPACYEKQGHMQSTHIRDSHIIGFPSSTAKRMLQCIAEGYTVEPPNKGHVGTRSFVLYREVSFIRRLKCTGIIGIGTSRFVLYREVSFIRSVLYRRFHCIESLSYIRCVHAGLVTQTETAEQVFTVR